MGLQVRRIVNGLVALISQAMSIRFHTLERRLLRMLERQAGGQISLDRRNRPE